MVRGQGESISVNEALLASVIEGTVPYGWTEADDSLKRMWFTPPTQEMR